ncbi:MAG: hypothetical protein HFJ45_06920 [Clostridia bacterium]|nr:hypothetical protein [Clostridia bacterium]
MNRMIYKRKKKKTHQYRTLFFLIFIASIVFFIYQYTNLENMDAIKEKFAVISSSTENTFSSEHTISRSNKSRRNGWL